MIAPILIGTTVIFVTIVIQVLFISIAINVLIRVGAWLIKPPFIIKTTISMVVVMLWLLVGIGISAWSWAGVFIMLGVFNSLEPSLYFSIVTFTTLGYGDITLDAQWRLLASFTAMNGLVIFGLNTAFLVEFTSRLRSSQEKVIEPINNRKGET